MTSGPQHDGSPFRRAPEPLRFSLTVNGEIFEGDHFIEIINALRERGHGKEGLVQAALAVTNAPRGASLSVESGSIGDA